MMIVVFVVVVMMMMMTINRAESCEQLRNIFQSIHLAAKNVFPHSHE
jgi:hypothetical protein